MIKPIFAEINNDSIMIGTIKVYNLLKIKILEKNNVYYKFLF